MRQKFLAHHFVVDAVMVYLDSILAGKEGGREGGREEGRGVGVGREGREPHTPPLVRLGTAVDGDSLRAGAGRQRVKYNTNGLAPL